MGRGPRTPGRHRTGGPRRTVGARAGQTRLAECRAANLPPALLSGPTSRTPADSTSSQGHATSPAPTPLLGPATTPPSTPRLCCLSWRPTTSPLATPLVLPGTSPFPTPLATSPLGTPLLDQEGARGWLT